MAERQVKPQVRGGAAGERQVNGQTLGRQTLVNAPKFAKMVDEPPQNAR